MIGLKNRKLSEKDSSLSDQEPEQSEAETSVDGRVYALELTVVLSNHNVLILLYLCLIMSGHLYCIIAMVITQVSTGTIVSLVIILNS